MLNKNSPPPLACRLAPALLALIAINLLLLAYYVIYDYQLAVHADAAVMNTLAQEIHDSGQFFPRGWNYANGDLWVLGTHTVIVALLAVLPNTFALHAASGMVTAALVLGAAWWCGAVLGQSRPARLLTLAVLAGGISVNMAENLYGQAAYGMMFAQAGLLACSGWRLLHSDGAARWRWGALFALLMLLVFWSNPARAAVYYGLPLMAATVALRYLPWLRGDGHGVPARRAAAMLATLLAALAAGALLHGHYVKLVGSSGLAPAAWLGFDGMVRNALGTLRGLLSLFGGLPTEGAPVIKAAGVWQALRLLAALAMLGLLPWALRRAFATPSRPARLFFAVFVLVSLSINLLVAVCTTVPDMAAPEASVRYLVPSLLCALVLLAGVAVDDFHWRGAAPALAVAALAVMALSARPAYQVERAPGYFPKAGMAAYSPYHQFADFLDQQNLHYGYTTFWHAGRLTLLSGGKVKVRQIGLDNGLPVPVRHLSSDRWYDAAAWTGPTFLMLTAEEAAATDWAHVERLAGKPTRVIEHRGWKIYCYADNLAARLPFWDYQRSPPLRLAVGAASEHRIGRLLAQGAALRAEPGESGHLLYGAPRALAAGTYVAEFDLDSEGADDAGVVDIAANNGATVLAAQPIRGAGRRRVALTLKLAAPAAVEFRVWSNGAARLTVHGVDLRQQDPRRAPPSRK
ncbi:hypothetical protein NHH82_07055 [Oxalobacteraceae bacterium OTU3REALA1]|nr:hypothetical protein NHH82_07055 [Oxalobacteraceae bacterium OTU3REALA1]